MCGVWNAIFPKFAVVSSRSSAEPKKKTTVVLPENLDKYLGVKRYHYGIAEEQDQVGHVSGLAWTEVGVSC